MNFEIQVHPGSLRSVSGTGDEIAVELACGSLGTGGQQLHPRDIYEALPSVVSATNLESDQIEIALVSMGHLITGIRADGFPLAWDFPAATGGYSPNGQVSLCSFVTEFAPPSVPEAVSARVVRWQELVEFYAWLLCGRVDGKLEGELDPAEAKYLRVPIGSTIRCEVRLP